MSPNGSGGYSSFNLNHFLACCGVQHGAKSYILLNLYLDLTLPELEILDILHPFAEATAVDGATFLILVSTKIIKFASLCIYSKESIPPKELYTHSKICPTSTSMIDRFCLRYNDPLEAQRHYISHLKGLYSGYENLK